MMFFHDPAYMLLMLVGAALVFLPQLWVKHTVRQYLEVGSRYSGADVARRILQEEGLLDVRVEMVPGELSDHYDPGAKAVRLSEAIYTGRSISGVAIAAHEVGHALQHAHGYYPVVLRSALVPAVNLGSQVGPLLFMISLGLGVTSHGMPEWAWLMAWLGVLLFGLSVVFHLVTLPVEINASLRAVKILSNGHYLEATDVSGARWVLTAAAFTYVAAALYSLMQLMYYIFRLLGTRRDD